LGQPIERPKSVTTRMLEEIVEKALQVAWTLWGGWTERQPVVYLSFRKFELLYPPHPCHCEPPQAAKQSPYWPGDCFASLAMTGDGWFFMACGSQPPCPVGVIGRLAANFLNEWYSILTSVRNGSVSFLQEIWTPLPFPILVIASRRRRRSNPPIGQEIASLRSQWQETEVFSWLSGDSLRISWTNDTVPSEMLNLWLMV
jgi:hypothetical protein